jgi:hypothetical protein
MMSSALRDLGFPAVEYLPQRSRRELAENAEKKAPELL